MPMAKTKHDSSVHWENSMECKGGAMSQRRPYNASRGGHAPGHLRDALLAAFDGIWDDLEEGTWWTHLDISFFSLRQQIQWETWSPRERAIWLTGQLWNCCDILPGTACLQASLPTGSTYAQLVRRARNEIAVTEAKNRNHSGDQSK
jgi:hypothetical protein